MLCFITLQITMKYTEVVSNNNSLTVLNKDVYILYKCLVMLRFITLQITMN